MKRRQRRAAGLQAPPNPTNPDPPPISLSHKPPALVAAGLLYKHVDYRNGHSESRRSRRLVLSFIATVVNYEYAFYISLYQARGLPLLLFCFGGVAPPRY